MSALVMQGFRYAPTFQLLFHPPAGLAHVGSQVGKLLVCQCSWGLEGFRLIHIGSSK